MSDTPLPTEPPDYHQYRWVNFYRPTVEFFLAATRYYEALLTEELAALSEEPSLSALLDEDVRREFRVDRGREEAVRVREWLEKTIADRSPTSHDFDISLSHGTARYLKSLSLLYLAFLRQRRNEFSSRKVVTSNLLSAIDRQISQLEELVREGGIFKNASPIALLVEPSTAQLQDSAPQTEQLSVARSQRPRPVVLETIEILDNQLRSRCLDLFHQFQMDGQTERLDTVVTEATRILEDRVRSALGITDGVTGIELAHRAFGGKSPPMRVSGIEAEQESVHLLFRGVFGFVRNSVHHRLHPNMTAERTLQILGLVDYLMSLVASAPISMGPPTT